DLIQWPLPTLDSSLQITSNLVVESTRNQLDELKKKLTPVQQIIVSLRPKKKMSLYEYLPDFEVDGDVVDSSNEGDIQPPSLPEIYETEHQESLSEKLYNEIDAQTTRMYSLNRSYQGIRRLHFEL
ncbi:unnamed protein product, partial [Rotaria socialis]